MAIKDKFLRLTPHIFNYKINQGGAQESAFVIRILQMTPMHIEIWEPHS